MSYCAIRDDVIYLENDVDVVSEGVGVQERDFQRDGIGIEE